MMVVSELYKTVKITLEKAGCDSPAFDACCLLEDLASLPRGRYLEADGTSLAEDTVQTVLAAASRRAEGEPLQYILGEWDFLDLTLSVGKGVLIPRPDTELLCEIAAEQLRNTPHPTVLDLCAGSGCVGLGLCSLLENVSVTEVELSEEAAVYLRDNLARYPAFDAHLVMDDVLSPSQEYPLADAILSNPPYIPSADIDGLMREVQHEPKMALDGDKDGLRFYRAITKIWVSHLKTDGLLAVEIGIGQATDVKRVFETAGLRNIAVYRDLGGIERVVTGRK